MYGGTGRGRLSALALTVAVLGAGTACQDQTAREIPGATSSPVTDSKDASAEVDPAAYDAWEPTFGEVRPATPDDIASLRQRVADLNAMPYSVSVPLLGFDIASAPDHVRVRFGEAGSGGFDLHLDPAAAPADTFFEGFVICPADEGSCVEVGEDRPEDGGPHLFNNGADTMLFYANSIVGAQLELPDELGGADEGSVTTVESPAGTLDCLLTGSTPEKRERLAGKPIDLMADSFSYVDGPEPLRTVCLDERGLAVVTLPSLVAGVVAYDSFTTGVPDGFDEHPDPVPYGTTPSATPTPTPTPSSGDEVTEVLVARDDIEEGESLQDVLAAGKLQLTTVRVDQLVPGSVSSTRQMSGRALRDIYEGEQIVSAAFG